jgi:hypothetical protein
LVEKPEGKRPVHDIGIDGRIILRWTVILFFMIIPDWDSLSLLCKQYQGTHLCLILRLRKHGALPPLLLHTYRGWYLRIGPTLSFTFIFCMLKHIFVMMWNAYWYHTYAFVYMFLVVTCFCRREIFASSPNNCIAHKSGEVSWVSKKKDFQIRTSVPVTTPLGFIFHHNFLNENS